jgi:hypothetical protein
MQNEAHVAVICVKTTGSFYSLGLCPPTCVSASGVTRGVFGGGVQPPPHRNSEGPQNRTKLNPILKTVKNFWISDAKTQRYSGNKSRKILKLPPVRNCFTLAITNKFVGIVNNLKKPRPTFCVNAKLWPRSDMRTWAGSFFLEPGDIKNLNLGGAIWNYSKAAGLPWFAMGHKVPVLFKA